MRASAVLLIVLSSSSNSDAPNPETLTLFIFDLNAVGDLNRCEGYVKTKEATYRQLAVGEPGDKDLKFLSAFITGFVEGVYQSEPTTKKQNIINQTFWACESAITNAAISTVCSEALDYDYCFVRFHGMSEGINHRVIADLHKSGADVRLLDSQGLKTALNENVNTVVETRRYSDIVQEAIVKALDADKLDATTEPSELAGKITSDKAGSDDQTSDNDAQINLGTHNNNLTNKYEGMTTVDRFRVLLNNTGIKGACLFNENGVKAYH